MWPRRQAGPKADGRGCGFSATIPRAASDDRPVLDWVAGNTYEHYAEHISWINQLIESSAAR